MSLMETKVFKSIATAPKNLNAKNVFWHTHIIQITDSEQYLSNCAGGWHFLLGIAACHTSSGARGSAAGSSARNHHSSTFRSFIPGTSPGGGAVTGTSPCRHLQLIAVTLCGRLTGLGVL